MNELQSLKLDCEAVACSNVCGSHENNLSVKRLGIRAYKAFEDEIGVEFELLTETTDSFNDDILPKDASEKEIKARMAEVKRINGLFKKMLSKTAEIEYEEIKVSTTREDGKDFTSSFTPEKILTIKGKQYKVNPYDAFLNLEIKGFISTK